VSIGLGTKGRGSAFSGTNKGWDEGFGLESPVEGLYERLKRFSLENGGRNRTRGKVFRGSNRTISRESYH